MCGITGLFGPGWSRETIDRMVAVQRHRGPDASDVHVDPSGQAFLGHNRLSIIDLSDAGRQPMASADGRYWIAFNGEVYNYRELRAELADYPFRSQSDTEVVLAAYARWGAACLDRFVGMFALMIWDSHARTLFAARDRLGVKPLHYVADADGRLAIASEIRTLGAAGVRLVPDAAAWATFLVHGQSDDGERTFWSSVKALPAGSWLLWRGGAPTVHRWYDLAERVGVSYDERPDAEVAEEYLALLDESVRLRFRADVPVGINLSGGVDSSTLLGLVERMQGDAATVQAFTFTTGDERYDELPWVRGMVAHTRHPLVECRLQAENVPALAESVHAHQDEPFGGIPTLAYARLFESARERGVIVLLDGQGMDEQWAGYDYYRATGDAGTVQGTAGSPVRPACLTPEFRALARPMEPVSRFPDRLRDLQLRDATRTKLPRALRYNDRVSMRASTELREPFLDHRLVELAMRQPAARKIGEGTGKLFLRRLARELVPASVLEAPKRPLQTPQREWLRGPLRGWADERIETALDAFGGEWFDADAVRAEWRAFARGEYDNSVFVWQWVSAGLLADRLMANVTSA